MTIVTTEAIEMIYQILSKAQKRQIALFTSIYILKRQGFILGDAINMEQKHHLLQDSQRRGAISCL